MRLDWARYPNFSEAEFRCRCGCGRADMDAAFMARLQEARTIFGAGMAITSGFRCPAYNARVSATGRDGPHTTGLAADIAVGFGAARKLLGIVAADRFFSGIGINQKGAGRFMHIDMLAETSGQQVAGGAPPRPALWSY